MPYKPRHARRTTPRRSKALKFFRAVFLTVLCLLFLWPFAEPFMLETEAVTITSADFPAELGELRIVYLTDIHAGTFFGQSRVDDLVSRVNALNPDLILLGGDYADSSEEAIAFFESSPGFRARYAVLGVVGNHDRTAPESNLIRLKSAMLTAGVTPLINEVARVNIGGTNIAIAGIDDIDNGWPNLSAVARQINADEYTIFLCHSPAVIPDAFAARSADDSHMWFDLGLFGHTHGGQIALLGSLLNPVHVPSAYQQGWFTENRADLLVSRGVGTSILPIRWLCTPQIHLITVTR